MEKNKIEKINEYARRLKNGEKLSPGEVAERDALRAEYIAEFRAGFRAQLENTVIEYPDGTKKPLSKDKQ